MRARWFVAAAVVMAGSMAAADSPFKNLQVLPKTMAKDELKQIMKAQSKALDVECDFCHDVPDMASDKNEKKVIARQMLQMTDELNAKWIKKLKGGEKHLVTCGTCHRGKDSPTPFETK